MYTLEISIFDTEPTTWRDKAFGTPTIFKKKKNCTVFLEVK